MVLLKILVVKSNHTSKIISLEYISGSGITYWKGIKMLRHLTYIFTCLKSPLGNVLLMDPFYVYLVL